MKEENPTYYETIVHSQIWKEWTKYAEDNLLFDMPESIECGWLSEKHWNAFIEWVGNKRYQEGYKDGYDSGLGACGLSRETL